MCDLMTHVNIIKAERARSDGAAPHEPLFGAAARVTLLAAMNIAHDFGTAIPRTRTKSGHEIRSATPKIDSPAPHPNTAKAWFTQAPLANQKDVDIETWTQPQASYVINLCRRSERVQGSDGRKPTRPCPQTSVRWMMKRKVAQR